MTIFTGRGSRRHEVFGCKGGQAAQIEATEASVLMALYVTAKHGLIGLAEVVAKEGAAHGVRANVICPWFVRTPRVDKQIPEQAKLLGISQAEVIGGRACRRGAGTGRDAGPDPVQPPESL